VLVANVGSRVEVLESTRVGGYERKRINQTSSQFSLKPCTSSRSVFKVTDFLVLQSFSSNIHLEVDGMASQASIYLPLVYMDLEKCNFLTSYVLRAKDCPQHLPSRDSSVALTIIDLHPVLTIRNLHV